MCYRGKNVEKQFRNWISYRSNEDEEVNFGDESHFWKIQDSRRRRAELLRRGHQLFMAKAVANCLSAAGVVYTGPAAYVQHFLYKDIARPAALAVKFETDRIH